LDSPIVYIALVVVVLGVVFAVRIATGYRELSVDLSEVCRELGVPDIPFDFTAAAREVVAGTRPGLPRDGQRWWRRVVDGQS